VRRLQDQVQQLLLLPKNAVRKGTEEHLIVLLLKDLLVIVQVQQVGHQLFRSWVYVRTDRAHIARLGLIDIVHHT
jgi:hypothetical protein